MVFTKSNRRDIVCIFSKIQSEMSGLTMCKIQHREKIVSAFSTRQFFHQFNLLLRNILYTLQIKIFTNFLYEKIRFWRNFHLYYTNFFIFIRKTWSHQELDFSWQHLRKKKKTLCHIFRKIHKMEYNSSHSIFKIRSTLLNRIKCSIRCNFLIGCMLLIPLFSSL